MPKRNGTPAGVAFPETGGGKRSTTVSSHLDSSRVAAPPLEHLGLVMVALQVTGKRIIVAALRAVGQDNAAMALQHEKNWRFGYRPHFQQLCVAMSSDSSTVSAITLRKLAPAF